MDEQLYVYDILKLSIRMMKQRFENYKKENSTFTHMSSKSFIKEFCAIKLGFPRRCGHTNAIARFINENPKYSYDIVSPTHQISKMTEVEIKGLNKNNIDLNVNMYCSENIGVQPINDIVFVDCSNLMSKKDIELIYSRYSLHMHSNIENGEFSILCFMQ